MSDQENTRGRAERSLPEVTAPLELSERGVHAASACDPRAASNEFAGHRGRELKRRERRAPNLPFVTSRRIVIWLCFTLAIITWLCYRDLSSHQFISFDDRAYIVANEHVTSGVTWPGVLWALRSSYASNWHPLTWISHMLDCNLYGLNSAGHHLTSLLFHIANSILLFVLLRGVTVFIWRSFFVAALFAWHPLHVESVAW